MLTAEIKQFLAEHSDKTAEQLALLAGRYPELPMRFVAQQLKGRQRVRRKLPSWCANEDTVFGSTLSLEQCTSERVARYRAGILGEGRRAIDLTGGFGVDGRFLAERFERLEHVERNRELCDIASHNYRVFGLDGRVCCRGIEAAEALLRIPGGFDLVYVDPARRDARGQKVSELEACEPDLLELWGELLERGSLVAAKLSPGLDVAEALKALPGVKELRVISVDGECRELFLVAERAFLGEASIHCVNLRKEGAVDEFTFLLSQERSLEGSYGPPGTYIYEPNASIMKAGAFKSIARQWGLVALNPRTRLYGSERLLEGFPGRVFEKQAETSIDPREARTLFPERLAHVVSRNSGMSAEALRKKLKLKEGGDLFALGAAVSGVGRRLFSCRLVRG